MNVYKFRAESLNDKMNILEEIQQNSYLYSSLQKKGKGEGEKFTQKIEDGELTFTFSSSASLSEWKRLFHNVIDCHVAAETLQLKKNYTGERDYKDKDEWESNPVPPIVEKAIKSEYECECEPKHTITIKKPKKVKSVEKAIKLEC